MKRRVLWIWIATCGIVGAQTTTVWNPAANPAGTGLWIEAANWTGGIVPEGNFKVVLNVPNSPTCILNSTQTVVQLVMGDNNGPVTMKIANGGHLTTTGEWTAVDYNHDATLEVEAGGSLTTGGHLWVGLSNAARTGTLIVNGGIVSVNGMFGCGWGGGNGIVKMQGGTLNLMQFNAAQSINTAGSFIDITYGTVIINGDQRAPVAGYITANKIRAFGGKGTVVVDYNTRNPGKTTITAIHPMKPSPAMSQTIPQGNVTLSWTNMDPNKPGDPVYVDVWFGADPNKTDPWSYTKVLPHSDQTSVTVSAPSTEIGKPYYWQVDSYIGSDADPIAGDVFVFYATNDLAPVVNAGPDIVQWFNGATSLTIPMVATVIDESLATAKFAWAFTGDATGLTLSDVSVENPTVTVTRTGVYTLTLTVTDQYGQTGSDDLVLSVFVDDCAAAKAQPGYVALAGDLDGDCNVDISDFELLAADWLKDVSLQP